MLSTKIFKAYDVRGLYPQEVNEESVQAIGQALMSMWEEGSVVIAHDGRHGSKELARFLEDTISKSEANKFKVIQVGLTTTPMFYFLVNHLHASGGAMITASHNPKEYNGVKAVGKGAFPFSGKDILNVIQNQ